ncbi:MAG: redoxin domain-containing protein [Rariglobus sp.]
MKTSLAPPSSALRMAPPIQASEWLNTAAPLTLEQLRGRVVVLHAFQMLCPGCVAHGIPQAVEIQRTFDPAAVAVIGLHSVFEHHAVMTPDALRVFVHEYRLTLPIAIDQSSAGHPLPLTMRAYGMQGTPTVVLIDAQGRLRAQHFGQVSDLVLGAEIGQLVAEQKANYAPPPARALTVADSAAVSAATCDANACSVG